MFSGLPLADKVSRFPTHSEGCMKGLERREDERKCSRAIAMTHHGFGSDRFGHRQEQGGGNWRSSSGVRMPKASRSHRWIVERTYDS
jgi:hypothetical protein